MSKFVVAILSIAGYLGVRSLIKKEIAFAAYKRYNKVNLELNIPPSMSTKALRMLLKDLQENKEVHSKRLSWNGLNPPKLLDYMEWEYRKHVNTLVAENSEEALTKLREKLNGSSGL